jgi:hypothetical protein
MLLPLPRPGILGWDEPGRQGIPLRGHGVTRVPTAIKRLYLSI